MIPIDFLELEKLGFKWDFSTYEYTNGMRKGDIFIETHNEYGWWHDGVEIESMEQVAELLGRI